MSLRATRQIIRLVGNNNKQSVLSSPTPSTTSSSTTALFSSSSKRGGPKKINRPKRNHVRKPTPRTKQATEASSKQQPQTNKEDLTKLDPHEMASEFITYSTSRKPGTESILEMSATQRLQNYGLAAGLMCFVGWVWYYSMSSVGKAEGGMEQLLEEAQDARDAKADKDKKFGDQEQVVSDLLKAEMGASNQDEYGKSIQDSQLAIAAPEDIARSEEERNLSGSSSDGASKKRPLWKKVVFFWKKE